MAKYRNAGIVPLAFLAGEDLSASINRYRFVSLSASADKIALATAGCLPNPLGILQNSPCSGETASVAIFGPSKLVCTTTSCYIGIGSRLTSDASGHGVLVQTAGSPYAAVSLEALTSGSAILEVLINPVGGIAAS